MQVREYMYQLEDHLAEAHRQAQRLIKQQCSLGGSLAEFGVSMVSLGKFEQGHLADGFINLGEKAETLARTSQVGHATPSFQQHIPFHHAASMPGVRAISAHVYTSNEAPSLGGSGMLALAKAFLKCYCSVRQGISVTYLHRVLDAFACRSKQRPWA